MTPRSTRRCDVLLSDYAGHPFTAELAVWLRDVLPGGLAYSYCASVTTPKGDFDRSEFYALSAGRRFDKYNLRRRLVSELRYGVSLARLVRRRRPAVHVVCNMPLVTLSVAWLMGVMTGTRLVVWFQDAQSGIAVGVLGQGPIARVLAALEGFLLRRADRVVAISDQLADEARTHGVNDDRITVLENWAPVAQIPTMERDNPWARSHGLTHRPIFLYAGTLGRKHRPELLVKLADFAGTIGGHVVVVSEGDGADWLLANRPPELAEHLSVVPYQSFADLPAVLASADVLVVLLEPHAGRFSVPSKVLSYLCAGRPVLASLPGENLAARLLRDRAGAGCVVAPGADDEFVACAEHLAGDPELRERMGASGRAYAERHFQRSTVVDAFLAATGVIVPSDPVKG